LRVDQDVDLTTLVCGEGLRELDRGRSAGYGLGLQPGGTELLREVVGVVDPGRVDDARGRAEAVAIEACRRLVQRLVVEGCREGALFEVAADDWDRVDGRCRWNSEVTERCNQAAPRRVGERQVVD
jgi:hypothetical protein